MTRPARRRRPRHRPVLLVGVGAAVAPAASLVLFWWRWDSDVMIRLASFAGLMAPIGLLAVCAAAVARWRWAAAAAAAVTVAATGLQAPLLVPGSAPRIDRADPAPVVTVLQTNLMLGRADADALVAQVRADRVDVLTVQELTADAVRALRAAGLEEELPYSVREPRDGGAGAGVYSRHRLTAGEVLGGHAMANVWVRAEIGGAPVQIASVHLLAPYPYPAWRWRVELGRLHDRMQGAAPGEPVIVAGDFNATYNHRRFRDLLVGGYRDAVVETGAGPALTYPADGALPPLIGIDHIVTRGLRFGPVSVVTVAGSDHRGLRAELQMPARGGP